MTPAQAFAHRIADQIEIAERRFMRRFGATFTEAYQSGWDAFHDTLAIASAPDRPAVHEAARMISNPLSKETP